MKASDLEVMTSTTEEKSSFIHFWSFWSHLSKMFCGKLRNSTIDTDHAVEKTVRKSASTFKPR